MAPVKEAKMTRRCMRVGIAVALCGILAAGCAIPEKPRDAARKSEEGARGIDVLDELTEEDFLSQKHSSVLRLQDGSLLRSRVQELRSPELQESCFPLSCRILPDTYT